MRSLVIGAVAALWAGSAVAADKLEFGPPPAWVKVAEAPKPAAAAATGDIQILLSDHQDRYGDGQESYIRNVFLVRTPQGLAALSNLGITWKPDTDAVTVNHLRLIRGDKVIDVLANQTFTILRRETNLELAVLSGDLTAAIQPEGMEAGDLIDFAYTLKRQDPTLQGRSEFLSGFSLPVPIDRLRVRELWPTAKPIRWRTTTGLAAPRLSRTPDGSELLIDETALQPLKAPSLAPARFSEIRQLEVSEFASWNQVSALMEPLFAKAATLKPDSPLRAEAARIAAASNDPKIRAGAALKLVEDKVRYVFLGMNLGGYVPASADQTWSRRFGDCKGKTVVLLALLRELGVEAEPALISIGHGDGLDGRLPMLELFDHVVVRATIGGRTYWLDATRSGDGGVDTIATPNFHWALPLRAAGAGLERLTPPPLSQPASETRIRFDASGGLDTPAPAHLEFITRGDAALYLRLGLANLTPADLQTKLKEYWKDRYDWIEPTAVAAAYDEATGEERFTLDGTAKMQWSKGADGRRQYQLDGASLGWKADFTREPSADAKAPFAIDYPSFSKTEERIRLPIAGLGFEVVGADVDTTVTGVQFKRTTRIDKDMLTMEASTRATQAEFPAGDAPAAQKALRALWDVDVIVRAPGPRTKPPTPAEMDQILAAQPTTAAGFRIRGMALLQKRQVDQAIAAFDKAIAMEPKDGMSWASRGFADLDKGDFKAASADFDKAVQLSPGAAYALRGQAAVAGHDGRYQDAIKAFDASLAAEPGNTFALRGRGEAKFALHDDDGALADLAEALRINPDDVEVYLDRANVFARRNQLDLAEAEMTRMLARKPHDVSALNGRGDFLSQHGRKPEAVKFFDQAIAIEPTASSYLARALARDPADRAARLADVDQALRLEPNSSDAHQVRARIYSDGKEFAAAALEYAEALRLKPTDRAIAARRQQALVSAGKGDEVIADLDKEIAATPADASLLNTRCWIKGTLGRDLPGALADCDAALKLEPGVAAMLDSRGLVELKLGRLDAALADYDAALKGRPSAASLFGRGLVKLRAGKTQDGQADLAAARALSSKIDEEFAGYGLKP